jgi:hypothetical protein
MKLRNLLQLLALVIVLPALAQTKLTTSIPYQTLSDAKSAETVGISTERLERLDKVMKGFVESEKLPGLVAILIRNGQIVYHQATLPYYF